MNKIPIYKPYLPESVLRYAHDAINSGWISSQGEYKEKVEDRLKEILKIKHVLLVNSGTAAVHLISKSLQKFEPYIKKIIVPNNVYVAAWNGFLFDGDKFELIPIDADINTWCINNKKIPHMVNSINTAILVVHNISSIVNIDDIRKCYPDVIIVEDACEGFLGKYNNKNIGSDSLCSSISFFANKNITGGEAGAFLTNNTDIYEFAKKIHGQGQSSKRYVHDELGYNYRLNNISASIIYGQLEILDDIIEKKKHIFDLYRTLLSDIDGIRIQQTDKGTEMSNWMFGIRIVGLNSYDNIEKYFNEHNIEIRPMFYPMYKHKHLYNIGYTYDDTIANILSYECLMLPSYPELTISEIEYIVNTLKQYIKNLTN